MAHKLAEELTAFLFRNQCVLRDFIVPPGSSSTQFRFTRGGQQTCCDWLYDSNGLNWSFPGGPKGHSTAPGKFWLNPFSEPSPSTKSSALVQKRDLPERLAMLKSQALRVLRHLRLGGFDIDTQRLAFDLIEAARGSELPAPNGFLCEWTKDPTGSAVIRVIDLGGILDDNPNGEASIAPQSVMANYYADAYSAYCFARKFLLSQNQEYLEAAYMALDFCFRSYEDYPRGATWHHHEFKNAGIIETLVLLRDNGLNYQRYLDKLWQLRCDRYEPTNVFALRHYWKAGLAMLSGREDAPRQTECVKRLYRDTTPDGLIMDNNDGLYDFALDLTYHQYSLACLAGSLQYQDDHNIRAIFLKGCEFSRSMLMRNGEPSYNGRGANNIYHIASTYFATAFAQKHYGFKAEGMEQMISLLSRFIAPDGSLPTALNAHGEKRMGWNHCRTPYNALSAFLLYKGGDFKPLDHETQPLTTAYPDSGYAIIKDINESIAVFAGKGMSYIYSGAHRTGISGTANLIMHDAPPLYLCLDHSTFEDIYVTDLPTIRVDGIEHLPMGGSLRLVEKNLEWILETPDFVFKRTWSSLSGIHIRNDLTVKRPAAIQLERWFAAPIHTEEWDAQISKDGLVLESQMFRVKLLIADPTPSISTRAIRSNPRGNGTMYYTDRPQKLFSKGDKLSLEWSLKGGHK